MHIALSRLLLLLVVFLPFVASSTTDSPSKPVRLLELVGPRTIEAGAVGHFRARVSEESARPVNFLWDLGDGTLSMGALVSYAYATPGAYTITVVARNATGRDTLKAPIHVTTPVVRPDTAKGKPEKKTAAPVAASVPIKGAGGESPRRSRVTVPREALYGSGGIAPETGGYTWVVKTDLWAERVRDQMLRYRLRGFRADVYVDTSGRGSPAHRIVLGQFETRTEALAARPWLPHDAMAPWLLELDPEPIPASVER
jgi:hypothetical protein